MAKKFYKEKDDDEIVISKSSGEIKRAVMKTICETPEDFIKLYLTSIENLLQLNPTLLEILVVILKYSKFSDGGAMMGNYFHNDIIFKERCRTLLKKPDLTDGAINTYISRLASQQILIRQAKGTFFLNPRYFFKGTITNASRLKLVAVYESKK